MYKISLQELDKIIFHSLPVLMCEIFLNTRRESSYPHEAM